MKYIEIYEIYGSRSIFLVRYELILLNTSIVSSHSGQILQCYNAYICDSVYIQNQLNNACIPL